MIKRYFLIIFWVLFISIFSYFFWWEYHKFYENSKELQNQNKQVESNVQNFQLSDIRTLKNTSISHTPNPQVLTYILDKIDTAQNHVLIEVYILTEKQIKESLKKAQKRGVNVQVILEKNPYKATNINNKTFDFLKKNKINVVWSKWSNYSLNHSKLLLIDNEAIISTWNLSYSTFNFNRDFFIFTKDKKIVSVLEEIFQSDFKWIKQNIYDSNLILSPNYSRNKLHLLINNAQKDIKIYFQYFKDENLEKLLLKKAWEGVKISAIISESSWKNDINDIKRLQEGWIDIVPLQKIKMHAKMILVDNKYLYIWSINFSNYSLDFNREIGLLLKNQQIITKILDIFQQDKSKNIRYD